LLPTGTWHGDGASHFATGDVMLAQKIALETFELDALAIANHDGRQGAPTIKLYFLISI
jgi:hypothetical protein